MAIRFSPGRCCGCGCTIVQDDFNREDSSDLGSKWTEVAGDWTIASNKLQTTNANALAVTTATGNSWYVTCTVTPGSTLGASVRVIVDYLDDANYLFVEISRPSDPFIAKLWRRSEAVDTQQGSTKNLTGSEFSVELCYERNGALIATLGGTNLFATVATVSGDKSGVGVGSTAITMTVDDFHWQRHKSEKASCPECTATEPCTHCDDETGPAEYQVVIAGVAENGCGDCAALNGTYVLPYFQENLSGCFWRYDFPDSICGVTALRVQIFTVGLNRRINIQFTDSGGNARVVWFKDIPAPIDCQAFDAEDIPWFTDGAVFGCNGAASTCELTAL